MSTGSPWGKEEKAMVWGCGRRWDKIDSTGNAISWKMVRDLSNDL